MVEKKEVKIWEFGDFQTPAVLAVESVALLRRQLSFAPRTIIEPTCGLGSFLIAAAEAFPEADKIIGLDINNTYLDSLSEYVSTKSYKNKTNIIHGDFFKTNWSALLENVPKPILIIGNPPWVTSSDIGFLQGQNLPEKSNFQNRKGFDAITGKANFDISEWMLIQHMSWLQKYSGGIAILCKTAVARKILLHSWENGIPTVKNRLVKIDALRHFHASVDACLFIAELNHTHKSMNCEYYESFLADAPSQIFGYYEGMVLSDTQKFHAFYDLIGLDNNYIWRSGVKHDCSRIMELRKQGNTFINGNGEAVVLEDNLIFPLLKSSDLGNGRLLEARLNVVVTQNRIGEATDHIRYSAPRTWQYLIENSASLDKRGSTIYKNKPRFSMFGIGYYAFAKWKVAISGFYKRLNFQIVGPIGGKPTMLDDTGYFLNCESEAEAIFLVNLLNSDEAKATLSSMIFWSDKRPITIDLLKRLHIGKLAERLGQGNIYEDFVAKRQSNVSGIKMRKTKHTEITK